MALFKTPKKSLSKKMEHLKESLLKLTEIATIQQFQDKMISLGYEDASSATASQNFFKNIDINSEPNFCLQECFSLIVIDNEIDFVKENDSQKLIHDKENQSKYVCEHTFFLIFDESIIDPDSDGTFANIEIGKKMVDFLKNNLQEYRVDNEVLHDAVIALNPLYTDISSEPNKYFDAIEPHLNDRQLIITINQMIAKIF